MPLKLRRTAAAGLAALAIVGAACSSGSSRATSTSHGSTTQAGTSSTTSTRGSITTVAKARPPAVARMTEHFVDASRTTPPSGDNPRRSTRALPTTILYPADGRGPYPLIVFAHGLGANPQAYDRLLRHWAAAGYVVAAPSFPLSRLDAPGGPDGADLVNQPGDVSFVITSMLQASAATTGKLAGLIDPDAVGAAGHSNGAITTLGLVAHSCCRDDRVKAAALLAGDPVNYPNGEFVYDEAPPLLIVHGTDDILLPYEDMVGVFNEVDAPKGFLTIEDGDHQAPAGRVAASFPGVARTTEDFFAAYLRDDQAARARIPNDAQPGVSTIVFAAEGGSDTTIPTVPLPKLDRRATVKPSTGLRNGQMVTVSWSGFTPGKVVNIVQCSDSSGTASACDLTHGKILQPDPTGAGSLQLEIVTGRVGTGVCDAKHPGCLVAVNDASSLRPESTIRIPITFAP